MQRYKPYSFRLPEELVSKIEAIALDRETDKTQLVRKILTEWVADFEGVELLTLENLDKRLRAIEDKLKITEI